ncbi:MAG: PQQ-like beta-propeller repeat protein [Verrucomicrobia bacterium]|nr:PQQ-like beta-propeller repeat protein [Verrucomicrobiota bacterium]
MIYKHHCAVSLAASLLIPTLCLGADWPQYRGPRGDGISIEDLSIKAFPPSGPKVVWKAPTRNGFSSFAVNGNRVYTQVNRDLNGEAREVVVALDAANGQEVWFADVGSGKYDGGGDSGAADNKGGDGPRSTPTVNGGKVYAFNQHLVLHCLDLSTGKSSWSVDLMKEHAGRNIGWKNAASVVIDGEFAFVGGGGPGESLLALNKSTGQVGWKAQDEMITHATPVVTTIQGVRQAIFFMQSGLVSVNVKDGQLLWKFPFRYNVSTASSPVVAGDIVYCSAGYGVGGGACKITKTGDTLTATELYKVTGDKKIPSHWSTPVLVDGYLYGMFSFKDYGKGPLKCVEVATGQIKWEQPGFGGGNVLAVKDQIVALSDKGVVVVVKATPEAYTEITSAQILTGKCWSTPALSDGRLYVRSTKEGACIDLR